MYVQPPAVSKLLHALLVRPLWKDQNSVQILI